MSVRTETRFSNEPKMAYSKKINIGALIQMIPYSIIKKKLFSN